MKLDTLEIMGKIKRTGWILSRIPIDLCENVAERTLKVAFLTLHLSNLLSTKEFKINVDRALKMALIHNLPETIISDIPKNVKDKIEENKLVDIYFSSLSEALNGLKENEN